MEKLLIHNAQVATSQEVFCGGVLAENGMVTGIFRQGDALPALSQAPATRVIDAEGKVLLPGGVDAHTHFDLDVGFTRSSDDFYTGTVAAACGGTTTIIDHMAFAPKGSPLTHQPQVYHQLARPAVIDYGFHGTLQHVDEGVLRDMAVLRDDGITSLKLYMTYNDKLNDAEILQVLQKAKELGLIICSHCENDAAITSLRQHFVQQGHTEARYHPLSRPAAAEAEAVFRFLMLADIAGQAPVYVVHLSTALGLEAIRLARRTGQANVLAETCPQYLLLDDSRYNDPAEGLKAIMSPPLRKPADEAALWDGLAGDDIQTVGTDHCPFFFATQKQRGAEDFTQCPNGAPGVELRMALLFSEGVQKKRMTLPQLVRICCSQPARIFGIAPQKGDIQLGADADFVLFDAEAQWTVTKKLLHEQVDYTPYEGFTLQGRPVLTVSRGEVIAENGRFIGEKGRGQYLKRGLGLARL